MKNLKKLSLWFLKFFYNGKKVSSNEIVLYSQLNFDFAEMHDSSNIMDKKLNVGKIIGMQSAFKFFKPFLERCF